MRAGISVIAGNAARFHFYKDVAAGSNRRPFGDFGKNVSFHLKYRIEKSIIKEDAGKEASESLARYRIHELISYLREIKEHCK